MTTTTVPARTIVTCDRCGAEKGQWVHDSKLTLVRAGLDYQGRAVADASLRYDLCDQCSGLLATAIAAAMKSGIPATPAPREE